MNELTLTGLDEISQKVLPVINVLGTIVTGIVLGVIISYVFCSPEDDDEDEEEVAKKAPVIISTNGKQLIRQYQNREHYGNENDEESLPTEMTGVIKSSIMMMKEEI